MRVEQLAWSAGEGWTRSETADEYSADSHARKIALVLYFGIREALAKGVCYQELRILFPYTHIGGCRAGGRIHNNGVSDNGISVVR